MPKPKTLTIDGLRVKACPGSGATVSPFHDLNEPETVLVGCHHCDREYLAGACQARGGNRIVPQHTPQRRAEVA